jgi:DNA-binding response OmpR family regulator
MNKPFALIIEDDPDLSTIFAAALQAAEFETELIRDGRTALDRLAVVAPALVMLDLHLPQISGVDILMQIRAEERLEHTRVILSTANPLIADPLRSIADLVLIKPISFSQLRDLASRLRPPDTTDQKQ